MRTNHSHGGRVGLAVGLTLAVGCFASAADTIASKAKEESPVPIRHAFLGCSREQVQALYDKESLIQNKNVAGQEQRIYATRSGLAEIWFGENGVEGVLLSGRADPLGEQAVNTLEVIHRVLADSADGGTWVLDGRVWRRSDGKAVAIVTRKRQLWIAACPWLITAVENEATTAKE